MNVDKIVEEAILGHASTRDAIRWAMKQSYFEGVAAEREACAKLVEPSEEHRRDASWGYLGGAEGVELLDNIAKTIRERGKR